jgi:hypothetical protein
LLGVEVTTVEASPVPLDDELVDVGGVEGVHWLESQVVQDQQVEMAASL